MSARQRWIRVNTGWDDTEWIAGLSAEARLSWIMLLCHVKRDGIGGRCKVLSYIVAARKWGVRPGAVQEMVEAGREDGAIYEADGEWMISAWDKYQPDKSAERVRRHRERKAGQSE
jgi:hypothetical protein